MNSVYILSKLWFILSAYKIFFTSAAVRTSRNPLTEYIQHYEELNYPKAYLADGHSRVKRSLHSQETLHLNFNAHRRIFKLRLRRDTNLFADGLGFELDSSFKPENIYEGFLEDDPLSKVHGFVLNDIFEGKILTGDNEEFFIESSKQYKHLNHSQCHSVIYNGKDVINPERHVCGGLDASTQEWMNKQQNQTVWDDVNVEEESKNNYIHFDNNDGIEVYNHERRSTKGHHRERRSFNENLNECQLFIRADQTFARWATSNDRAMYLMTQYVKSVNHIYETTDFSGDGRPEQIALKIRRIEVIPKCLDSDDQSSLACQFKPDNIGVEKFLDLASKGDHNAYCLSYVFAHRDFSGGVLGLAWIGAVGGSGGICDKKQNFGSNAKTLNTGIVTNLNYGKTVSSKVTDITLAHEIGHNFGSKHDPQSGECAPGGAAGNFIMYARATSGANQNNFLFSKCSKTQIWNVLQSRSATCFKKRGDPICGNRIVEAFEECDCGYEGEESCVADQCCTPSPVSGSGGCKFSTTAKGLQSDRKKICSPSLGFCCDVENCSPYTVTDRVCAQNDSCKESAKCRSDSYLCPEPVKKANLTLCNNGDNVCIDGECTGSLCLRANMTSCQCEDGGEKDKKESCKVCCMVNNGTCSPYDSGGGGHIFLPPGSPCNNYNGYCDILQFCRDVDAEGPLSRLKDFIFSSKTFDNILDWMKTYWWACVLIGLGLVLFMAGFIACCSVHTPSSNPNKPPPRPMTLPRSLSRRGTRNRANAPPPSYDRHGYDRHGGHGGHQGPPGYDSAVRDSRQGYAGSMEMR